MKLEISDTFSIFATLYRSSWMTDFKINEIDFWKSGFYFKDLMVIKDYFGEYENYWTFLTSLSLKHVFELANLSVEKDALIPINFPFYKKMIFL